MEGKLSLIKYNLLGGGGRRICFARIDWPPMSFFLLVYVSWGGGVWYTTDGAHQSNV